jgi:protease-4
MTGDPIVAYPNTLTGSIGVMFGKLNLRGLYDKLGVQKEILSRGQFSGLYSDYTPLDDKETQKLRDSIDRFYSAFVTRVAEGRKRKYEDVEPLAQGRVWLGVQAKQNGLIDELGGLDRAIELVKQRAHVPAGEKITLVTYPPKKTLFELLMTRTDDTPALDLITAHVFRGFPVRSWLQGGFLKVMPYSITVK